ncbi:extracellular solute-binding protein [Salipiger marinus]|jgi:spermidine/putrescine transport system substrate-binding protein|uniref:Putrescine-binding periplasmic protein n=1 Tax=Salipiger marinus TaxID=555512 RepID=A0A1G8HZZ4_9RHOB|nr:MULTISPECIES: extracellular solute-binding protein [Salipiger]HBM61173.1 ABC transporter substrate-binding protein [Citreicella sp.]MCD1617045.1 extracellular solute-binding protein [Salipiger manganoxidans]MEB3417093.1 extracellular solute-binding protein [Salipiger manganoxidans]SDI12305.1 spermidine/putrescine transport system substrate-binding protein [Salipiger marinus]HBT01131.1 ABC transporter substrate-binding protein [Citreicella sp.]
MKTLLTTSLLALTLAGAAQAEGKLSIYHWFEYIPQELLDKFAAEYDVEVTMDTFDSNEALLAALKAGRLGSYDVAVPGDYMVDILKQEGMLDSFTPEELPNHGNIEDRWLDVAFDPGRTSSIPYQWGSTSFAVNREVYDGTADSLGLIFAPPPELAGKINVLDTSGETLTLASLYLGIPQCSADRAQLKALNDLVMGAKAEWASFGSDVAKDVLVSGDAAAGMIWSGFSAKARAEGAPIEYVFPKEGMIVWMDNVVLLKDAPNRDNALKFMNFLLEPENAAAVTNYAQYSAGVKGVSEFLAPEVANSPESNPPSDVTGVFVQPCPQEVQVMYDAIWTNLKK